jgi:23S rRNA (guanosine2251-2'-O)-methyltransferase
MKHSHRPRSKASPGKSGKFYPAATKSDGTSTAKSTGKSFAKKSYSGFKSKSRFADDRTESRRAPAASGKSGKFQHAAAKGDGAAPAKNFGKKSYSGFKPKNHFANDRPEKRRDHKTSAKPFAPKREAAFAPRDYEKLPRDGVLLWGMHAARAAFLNPQRRFFRLWMTESGKAAFEATQNEAKELLLKRPDAKIVERNELDRLTPPGTVHQGILIEVAPLHEPPLHEIISGDNPPDLLLMLDQVTDPHNVGAILRSAAAFGAGAIIMTERNAPIMTGVQAKSASGATEHVPTIHVVNLARTLDELQKAGYWCVGLAEEGEKEIGALDLSGRTVLVLGAEGEGLRQLTRKKCDELARLPTGGPIGSLNVSNAAAVALYEVRRQKSKF